MRSSKFLAVSFPLAVVAGCGSSEAPSRDAITSALAAELLPACFAVEDSFPSTRPVRVPPGADAANPARLDANPLLPVLQDAGLVRATVVEDITRRYVPADVPEAGSFLGRWLLLRYELTDAGRDAYRDSVPGTARSPGFCYAKRELVDAKPVEREGGDPAPKDGSGRKRVTVGYTYRLADVAEWARSPALQKQVPGIAGDLRSEVWPGSAQFVLSDEGWKLATVRRADGGGDAAR